MLSSSLLLFLSLSQTILARPAPLPDDLAEIGFHRYGMSPKRQNLGSTINGLVGGITNEVNSALSNAGINVPGLTPAPTPAPPAGNPPSRPSNPPSGSPTPPPGNPPSGPSGTPPPPPSGPSGGPPPPPSNGPGGPGPSGPGCVNSPTNRQCWSNGYNINTNTETTWPVTGKTVSYNIEIDNTTMSLDGVPRPVYAVNGKYPGPTLRANWGDMLSITVTNKLTTNGTSIHWHGIRQWGSNPMDGTNGITECPLAPGQTRTYQFLATEYGTSWYHSHFATQYSDGVVGTIVIDGPTSANYDEDLGVMPITDWFHTPVATLTDLLYHGAIKGAPVADNILLNGTNVNSGGSGGAYSVTKIQPGKKYKLRLINTATNDNYQIGLDGHKLTVVAADFVPIQPYTTDWLFIAIGQRYDVIIDTTADTNSSSSLWFHAVPQAGCSANKVTNGLAIFQFANSPTPVLPTANPSANLPPSTICTDPTPLNQYIPLTVPTTTTLTSNSSVLDVGFNATPLPNPTLVNWTLRDVSMSVNWSQPTLQYVLNNNLGSVPQSYNLINLPQSNAWTYWVVQTTATLAPAQPHPIHLHGHNFYVLGVGSGTFSESANGASLNYNNPTRRDTATLPAGGWLVLAFKTDNPGAWLMHCHVAWHVDLGLGMQFLEGMDQIPGQVARTPGWNQECQQWRNYYPGSIYKEEASGL